MLSRIVQTSKHTKNVTFNLTGKFFYVPAVTAEDFLDYDPVTFKKIAGEVKDPGQIVRNHVKRYKRKEEMAAKVITKVAELFFDTVLRDMITNNAVFMMPKEKVYLVVAQQSPFGSHHRYRKRYMQSRVLPFVVFTKKGFAIAKGQKKMITFNRKYQDLLNKELKNGHIYPVIDDVIKEMQNYGY